ncbi:ribosomal protein S18 acetylase RimI-like enzyme [Propionicimonas paludicola]|uniref:Ribosomal protein S18 acetylase RimI-like enzyme n=1 Tax=Propionicimonas paludicola TaxID=185243 RepID=A0A2A9CN29_9ACTN|nr:GNAT family N-acetyltransferase [Propionicimonas paludicola]PFG15738.1 ribosomal protein S18 acetylase RimI-like enzyme [Propionicimonas paludicola]
MSTVVRLASIDDAAAICALNARELGYAFELSDATDALARALKSPRDVVVVGVSSGEVVGYCHGEVYRLLYSPPMLNVLGVAVRSDCQRRGVGAALMTAIEEWGRAQGCYAIRLATGETREGAHAFYTRMGFTISKRQLNLRKPLGPD